MRISCRLYKVASAKRNWVSNIQWTFLILLRLTWSDKKVKHLTRANYCIHDHKSIFSENTSCSVDMLARVMDSYGWLSYTTFFMVLTVILERWCIRLELLQSLRRIMTMKYLQWQVTTQTLSWCSSVSWLTFCLAPWLTTTVWFMNKVHASKTPNWEKLRIALSELV